MATARGEHLEVAPGAGLALALLEAIDSPAVIVESRDTILTANAAWYGLFANTERSGTLPSVSEWLSQLTNGDSLAIAFDEGGTGNSVRTVNVSLEGRNGVRRFIARVAGAGDWGGTNHSQCVVLVDAPQQGPNFAADETQHTVRRLLVWQTLIEERERRRLGRALHDQVTQLLVHVRRQLAESRNSPGPQNTDETISHIDHVVSLLHELTCNFSPPVLEDLGLLQAMHWLADHLQRDYGAAVCCDDNGVEPKLSSEVRTIAFRAIRELANNAIKYAPDSRIVLRLRVGDAGCQFEVCDDGPGFQRDADHSALDRSHPFPGYGLLSVEQQIHAVGGTFEILTEPGQGTRVIITLGRSSNGNGTDLNNA